MHVDCWAVHIHVHFWRTKVAIHIHIDIWWAHIDIGVNRRHAHAYCRFDSERGKADLEIDRRHDLRVPVGWGLEGVINGHVGVDENRLPDDWQI